MILALILLNIVFSVAAFSSKEVMRRAVFNPYIVYENKEWWRFITSGFIHADWLHLAVNMFVLYSFGDVTLMLYEETFGERAIYYFLVMYFGGMVVASLPSYKKNKENPSYNSLGASGAISALLFAFILFQPMTPLSLYGFIKLPGIVLGALYLAYSYYEAKRAEGYINHEAHFWGAVFGVVFTIAMKPELFSDFIESITSVLQ